MSQTMYKI